MDGNTVYMSARKQKSLQEVYETICGIKGIEKISKTTQTVNDVQIWTLIFEMYYFRSGGYVSLTVVLTEYDNRQTACIAGSGGGQGMFNVSYGANRDFVIKCEDTLKKCGFDFTHF